MKKYSHELADAIRTHIKEHDLHMVSFDEELGSFSFNMHLRSQISSVNVIIRVGEDDIFTLAACPVRPDPNDTELMARMAEFVCRANFGLRNGGFEFDFDDGELRYKCYLPCGDQIPSQDVLRRAISIPALMIRRYSPGIIGVLYNHMDPADMVRECENLSADRRTPEEMQRARREALMRKLDQAASAAERSGALPSFDEFVKMDPQPDAAPDAPAAPADPGSSGEDETGGKSAE